MKSLNVTVTFLSIALLGSCANNSSQTSGKLSSLLGEQSQQNGRACFYVRDIQGYGVLEHNVISVDARQNYYLLTVLPGCTSLQTASGALFQNDFNEICGGGRSKIRSGGDLCTIRSVYEFENREQAFRTFDEVKEHANKQ